MFDLCEDRLRVEPPSSRHAPSRAATPNKHDPPLGNGYSSPPVSLRIRSSSRSQEESTSSRGVSTSSKGESTINRGDSTSSKGESTSSRGDSRLRATASSQQSKAVGPTTQSSPQGVIFRTRADPEVLASPGSFSVSVIISSDASLSHGGTPPGPPSQEADALESTAFSGIMGHKNAISDERSSIGRDGAPPPAGAHPSQGAPRLASPPLAPRPAPPQGAVTRLAPPHDSVYLTKTVNKPINSYIPDTGHQHNSHNSAVDVKNTSFKTGQGTAARAELLLPRPSTYPVAATAAGANNCLSSNPEFPPHGDQVATPPLHGWTLPPGRGLLGGAPQPGETSAMSNGTTGWGPPPQSNSNNSSGWGGGGNPNGNPNPGNPSAWGSSTAANSSNSDDTSNANKMLNSGLNISVSMSNLGTGLGISSGPTQSSGQNANDYNLGISSGPSQSSGQNAIGPSTSWAAAAGKGLPPSEPSTSSTTNKQLEQLNSVREALFSQDGWGGQNVKQDTSWDVGAQGPPAPDAADTSGKASSKADSMQWQAPSNGRNDGTDLWKSTLTGIPQQPKPQPATPWGNHTPQNPADYKTWGDPDEPEQPGGGGATSNNEPLPRNDHPAGGPSWGPTNNGNFNQNSQPWDQDSRGPGRDNHPDNREGMQARRQANNGPEDRGMWGGGGGPPKPSNDQDFGWSSNPSQRNNAPGSGDPRGGLNRGEGPMGGPGQGHSGWGPPPASKPPSGWQGQGQGAPRGGPGGHQWDGDSPTMGRRNLNQFNDGTDIWGGKAGNQPGGPGNGGWKDMPIPNITRGPPGPPGRMPPGPSMKPDGPSPWGHPNPSRPWGDDPISGWDKGDIAPRDPMGWGADTTGVGNWGGNPGKPRMSGLRQSPSWDDGPGMGGGPDQRGNWGPGGQNRGVPHNISKDMIWGSKQFRILCEMGFRKDDVETALRNTNLQMEDALEMLSSLGARSGMPPGGRMPPGPDVMGFPGPRADPNYDMRFPGPGMPYPPGNLPPGNASLQNNPSRGGNLNPAMEHVQQLMNGSGPHPGAPPRPAQNGPPSTSQLRVLVQQIQMAVQAGHLNPQILNQPLAPQTLLLLNQLLQQIKALQQCQVQHASATAAGGNRGSGPNNQALLTFSVQITKHKQQIANLQNQITAQQAVYLKNQQPQQIPGGPGAPTDSPDLTIPLSTLNIDPPPQQSSGSKLNQWKLNSDNADDKFSKAPGSRQTSTSQPSPNLLLEPSGPWSTGSNNAGSGWPDSSEKQQNTSNEEDNFGIPEFEPGKPWKGPGLKDPSEDPNITPGSVASTPIIREPGDKPSSKIENSLGLASSTWSFSSGSKDTTSSSIAASKPETSGWGGLPQSSSVTNLTAMGQDLWGQSRGQAAKTIASTSATSGWPTNGLSSTHSSWSSGGNGPSTGPSWLLLKNLTAQIDGSTLRTLCMQHGPLHNFHLYLTHGIALVKYSNGQEAKKAQNALNNCVLGNTTMNAETTMEAEVENILRTLGQHGGNAPAQNSSATPRGSTPAAPFSSGAPMSSMAGGYGSGLSKSSSSDTWSTHGVSGGLSLGWPSSSIGGSVWGAPDDHNNRNTPLHSFLPPDLLNEGM